MTAGALEELLEAARAHRASQFPPPVAVIPAAPPVPSIPEPAASDDAPPVSDDAPPARKKPAAKRKAR
jgi:hypothetical protein